MQDDKQEAGAGGLSAAEEEAFRKLHGVDQRASSISFAHPALGDRSVAVEQWGSNDSRWAQARILNKH